MGNAQVGPTPATSLTDSVRSVQTVHLHGFGKTSTSTGSGDHCVKLRRWSVAGHEWEVSFYPTSSVSNMWFSLKLALLAQPSAGDQVVTASLTCRLIHPKGLAVGLPVEKTVTATFVRAHGGESAPLVLAHRRDMEVSGYLGDDDSLTIECTVTVLSIPTDAHGDGMSDEGAAEPRPASNLHRHFGELLQSGTGADVTFLISGESFPAHTVVLAARSPVFMAKFFADGNEKKRPARVEVKGMEAADFKALLHFIYTDTAPELERQDENANAMARRILVAADTYGLDRLKLLCSRRLSSGVSVETAAATLLLAERYKCPRLKARCVEFIVGTPAILDAVLGTEGYKQLETSCPSVLADLLKSARRTKN